MELSQQEISLFINALKSCTEYDFSEYSIKSFTRRVEKLVTDNNLKITELIEKIRSNDEFLEKVVRDITVNTTELFRDPEIWRTIRTEIIPRYKDEPEINVWHAGCSTGQEIFSFLILINEFGLFNKTNVFASDLNSEVIEIAQSGKYKYREIDEYINNYTNAFLDTKMPPMANYIDISRAKSLIKIRAETRKSYFIRVIRESTNLIKAHFKA